MRLGLLITAHCNAACTHCATSCGPRRHEALTREQLFRIMDEAAAVNEDDELNFSISGGEPFIDFQLLLDIVAHGSALGASIGCQSNGYWASNDEQARSKLSALKQAGLGLLGLSISRFHDEFVRRSRVQRALNIAKELGIETALKCALTTGESGAEVERWARASGADDLELFPLHPYLREGAQLPAADFSTPEALPGGACPASILTVKEDGRAYTCCMPGGFNDFLALGHIEKDSIADLHDLFLVQGRQQLLRQFGPVHFARAVAERGEARRLRTAYADVCDLCAHITSDPRMSAIANESAAEFEAQQLQGVFDQLMREET